MEGIGETLFEREASGLGPGTGEVEQFDNRVGQVGAGGGQPDRVQVGADEVLVQEVEAGRRHLSADHAFGVAEVIRVMWRAIGGVGEDKGWLPRPPGPSTSLCVVGRGRRHVP